MHIRVIFLNFLRNNTKKKSVSYLIKESLVEFMSIIEKLLQFEVLVT